MEIIDQKEKTDAFTPIMKYFIDSAIDTLYINKAVSYRSIIPLYEINIAMNIMHADHE